MPLKPDADRAVPSITIAGIALAATLVPLNSTMIAVALPDIAREFDISKGHASVLVTVYLAAMLVGQPLAGRVGDAIGVRRLAVIAVFGFGLFSAAALFANSFGLLVLTRTVQAIFAAALSPSVQAMLRNITPPHDRGRAFGLLGSVIGVGAGLGPVIGGVLTGVFGWRAIFGANLPVVVIVLVVLQRLVPRDRVMSSAVEGTPTTRDRPRLVTLAFASAFTTHTLAVFAQYALLLATPLVLDSRGWSAGTIGLALSALTLGMVVISPVGGRFGDRHGRRLPVLVGLSVTLVAVAASAIAGDAVASALLVGTLLCFGLGLGAATPSILTAGIEGAPDSRVGLAAGMISMSRYVGSISATLVLAGVVADDGDGLAIMLTVCAAALALSVVAAAGLPGRRPASPLTP